MQMRKSFILLLLAVLLVAVLAGCTETAPAQTTDPTETQPEVPTTLYWNLDGDQYRGQSEAGMSSREPEDDGFYHIRLLADGREVTLKTSDPQLMNAVDIYNLMGIIADEDGIITEVVPASEMDIDTTGWQFYVQSIGGNKLKLNSSTGMNGIELLLELTDDAVIYDMTGTEGPAGTPITPIATDRIYCVRNAEGLVEQVFVYERPNYMLTHEAYCPHCDKEVTWSEWTKAGALPVSSGHYQLQNDVQLSGQTNQQADTKLCLDLNGKRVDGGKNKRVFSMHNSGCELAIMDTSEGQTGVMAAHGTSAQGVVVWIRYGQLYLYSGTLDASDAVATKGGTAVAMGKNKYFYMHGGTIIGGCSETQYNATSKSYSYGIGGALYISGGKFVMYDGEIRDGYAKSIVSAYNKDGTPKTYQQGKGGNIFVNSNGVVELYGGAIRNGRADNGGANLYVSSGATVLLDGCSITGGTTVGKGRNGGSVYLTSTARMTMLSGRISGGTCYNGGGNIYSNGFIAMSGGYIGGGIIRNYKTGKVVEDAAHRNIFNVNGTFRMYGGKIDGGFRATDSSATDTKKCYVGVAQHAFIDGGENSKNNLTLSLGAGGPVVMSVDKLLDDARVRVNAVTGIFTEQTDISNTDNFISDIPGAEVVYHDGRIGLGKTDCLCGQTNHIGACDGTQRFWALLTDPVTLKSGGNYYLNSDITTEQLSLGAGIRTSLDLNGYSLTAASSNVFLVNGSGAHLDLTDHTGGGKLLGKGFSNGSQGGTVYVRSGSMDIYSGTLTGREDMHPASHAGILSVRGTVNMYGGTVTGGKATQGGNISVTSSGVLSIYGGTVTGGTAEQGSNIYVSGNASLTLAGGNVDGGILLDGTPKLTLSGKAVVSSNNKGLIIPSGLMAEASGLESGASIAVNAGGYFAKGATATALSCVRHVRSELDVDLDGDKLFVGRKACLCGHTPHIGNCDGTQLIWSPLADATQLTAGGNYYLVENMTTGQINHKNGVVLNLDLHGYSLTATKTRVFMPYETTTVNIADHVGGGKLLGKAYKSGSEDQGGVIYARAGSTLNIYGGTVGQASGYGACKHGGIIAVRGTLNLYGGTIQGGKSTQYGGSISATSGGVVNLLGGSVQGGTAPMGGCVYADGSSKVNLKGSTCGDIYIANGATATVTDGSAKLLTVCGANLKLSGTPVIEELITLTHENGKTPSVTASGALESGASITVSATMADGVFTDNTLGAYAGFFYSQDEGRGVYAIADGEEAGMLYLGRYGCLCGKQTHVGTCDGTPVKWTALTSTASLKSGGSYYLTKDMTTGQLSIGKGIVTSLDLNGHDLIASGSNVFLVNGDDTTRLSICDHAGGGTVQGRAFETANQGGAVYIRAGNMDLYSGTVCKASDYQVANHGGLISVRGTFHMYGGAVTGGISQQYGGNISVSSSGICYIHGGIIEGGSAPKGGNICVTGSAKLYIEGGTVQNGIASESGGNLFVNNQDTVTFSMTGGSLLGGTATVSGGNLFVLDAVGTKSVTGGSITGGTAPTGTCAYVEAGTLTVGENAVIEKLETP